MSQALSLYKQLLRESRKFSHYSFRSYALRRVRDAFRANKDEVDPKKIDKLLEEARQNLQLIKRQVIIDQLYKTNPLVIEK